MMLRKKHLSYFIVGLLLVLAVVFLILKVTSFHSPTKGQQERTEALKKGIHKGTVPPSTGTEKQEQEPQGGLTVTEQGPKAFLDEPVPPEKQELEGIITYTGSYDSRSGTDIYTQSNFTFTVNASQKTASKKYTYKVVHELYQYNNTSQNYELYTAKITVEDQLPGGSEIRRSASHTFTQLPGGNYKYRGRASMDSAEDKYTTWHGPFRVENF